MDTVSALEAFKNGDWSFFDDIEEFENAKIARRGSIVLIALHELSDVYVLAMRSAERARELLDLLREMRGTHSALILPELMNHIEVCGLNDTYDDEYTYIFMYECGD
ncbi:MAG: hypothetical protein QXQ90_09050 [Desulfurococcaceae archaeon]